VNGPRTGLDSYHRRRRDTCSAYMLARSGSFSINDSAHVQRPLYCDNNINNNDNSKTMFMVLSSWQSHCESSPGSFDECRTAPSGRRPKTKPDDLGCDPPAQAARIYTHHRHLLLLLSPKSETFHRPTEGRRLSRPSWLIVTYRHGLPAHRRSPILVLTGSDIAQLR